MATSLKNECTRWAWQLLMAVCSVPYTLLLLGLFSWLETKNIKYEFNISGKVVFFSLIVFYYLISIWVHFLHDKKHFKNLIILSTRMWSFLFFFSLFYIYSFGYKVALDLGYVYLYEKINLFILFPIASIFFTWWISELIVRWLQKTRPDLLKSRSKPLKANCPSDLPELPNTLENTIKKALIRHEK